MSSAGGPRGSGGPAGMPIKEVRPFVGFGVLINYYFLKKKSIANIPPPFMMMVYSRYVLPSLSCLSFLLVSCRLCLCLCMCMCTCACLARDGVLLTRNKSYITSYTLNVLDWPPL